MKILQLHAGYRTPAGEDTVVGKEAEALRHAGHEVRQHIEQNPSKATAAISSLARSRRNRRVERDVLRAIDEFGPDVAHVHNTWFALSSSVFDAAASRDMPIVMTIHNYRLGCLSVDLFRGDDVCTACVGRSPWPGVVHGCYRESRLLSAVCATEIVSTRRRGALDLVDRFVAPTGFMGDRLIDIGVPAARLTIKPHFTDDAGARSAPPSASNDVLFIGRLAPGKGLHPLMRAWERYRSGHENGLHLVVIGDGPLASELHELAPRDVEFAGWLPYEEVRERMLAARALVFPSEWYEPFGMVLIEALSAGLPVIASTASDAAAITDTPETLVTRAGDEHELVRAFEALSDELVDRVGADARRRYEAEFSEDVGVANLERLYASVLDGHRR